MMEQTGDGQRNLWTMTPKIHYILAAIWALVTPPLTSLGAKMFVEDNAAADLAGTSHPGAPALEFFSMFFVLGVCCFAIFVVYDLICTIFFLAADGEKTKHFFTALIIYCLVCFGFLLALSLMEAWLGHLFG
jgi:hypothetical protein